jgi:GrpB-like predicted nucleotidyltransferase (UPF0157 family)
MKYLHEMTPEELGNLFPVFISDPDPGWGRLFQEEASVIKELLTELCSVRLEHIGSTAIPGLRSKPVIDILLEVPFNADQEYIIRTLARLDYHFASKPENPAPHMMFMKGYTPEGYRGQAFHIHVRHPGSHDELVFRDYLKAHPEAAKIYEGLKIDLAGQFRNDREGYTAGKTEFVNKILAMS